MITYYTDGSASPNPGPGGFAVIKELQPYLIGGEPSGEHTTNIRMEGFAIVAALEDSGGAACQIFTDSEFWINVITKWAPNWEANGWKKKGGEIKNLDIVKRALPLYKNSQAKLTWVRGHEGDEGNELADIWANIARERSLRTTVRAEDDAEANDESQDLEAAKDKDTISPLASALYLLSKGRTMQLGTLHGTTPRVTSVYYIASEDATAVYWLSEPNRRHSVDCENHAAVGGAVAVKTDHPVRGVQFVGVASVVQDFDEVTKVCTRYAEKYDGYGGDFPKKFLNKENKHVLYKMTFESLEVFDEVYFAGQSPLRIK